MLIVNKIAIAQHLKVEATQIKSVDEWSNCLFVVVKGKGARFVSKKVGMSKICKSPERWYQHIDDAAYACAKRIVDEKLEINDEILSNFIEEHHHTTIARFKKKVQDEIEAIAFINSQFM